VENQQLQDLLDREAIKEVRALFAQALDYKDWTLLESLFLEEVDTDFTSYGIAPQRVRREELAGSYRHNLNREGLRTQHITSNFRIVVHGNSAQCTSNFIGQHYIQGFEGGEEFYLRGEYRDQLVRTESGWKISALTFTLFYVSGNPAILAQ
jgi:3-phenylpropionate/cinnamic acid dioxygenase small subunit